MGRMKKAALEAALPAEQVIGEGGKPALVEVGGDKVTTDGEIVQEKPKKVIRGKFKPSLSHGADHIKLALWFIDKVGDINQAKAAIKAAAAVIKILHNEKEKLDEEDRSR